MGASWEMGIGLHRFQSFGWYFKMKQQDEPNDPNSTGNRQQAPAALIAPTNTAAEPSLLAWFTSEDAIHSFRLWTISS